MGLAPPPSPTQTLLLVDADFRCTPSPDLCWKGAETAIQPPSPLQWLGESHAPFCTEVKGQPVSHITPSLRRINLHTETNNEGVWSKGNTPTLPYLPTFSFFNRNKIKQRCWKSAKHFQRNKRFGKKGSVAHTLACISIHSVFFLFKECVFKFQHCGF